MNHIHVLKLTTTLLLILSLTSCSLFSSSKQTVKIIADDPQAMISVNGMKMGKGTVITKLKKTESATISATHGEKRGVVFLDPELSVTGILDIVGGCLFLFPFLGFFSGGAFQLDQDTVPVYLN